MKKLKMLFLCFYVFNFQYSLFSKSESLTKSNQSEISEETILSFLLQKSSLDVTDENRKILKSVMQDRLENTSVNTNDFYAHKHEFKNLIDDILSSMKKAKNDLKKSNESFLDKIPIKFLFYLGAIVFVDYKFNMLKKIKEIIEFIAELLNKEDEKQKKYVPFNKADGTSFLLNIKKYSNVVKGGKDFNIMLQRLCVENNICDLSLKKLENGVTRVVLPKKYFISEKRWKDNNNGFGLSGAKTLWPEHYTMKDILLAGRDILSQGKNVVSKEGKVISSLFEGVTVDKLTELKIKARVRIKKNGKIKTSFPEWYQ